MTAPRTEEPYFSVGLAKLALLTVCTFGFYQIYWFYQQWKREVARTGEDLWVVPRAIFAPIFAYSLFRRVHQLAAEGQGAGFSPGFLATAYIMINLAWRLPDPYWVAAFFAFLPLLPVQAAANRINQRVAPAAPRNELFTLANVAGIVVGSFLVLGVIAQSAQGPGLTGALSAVVTSSDGLTQVTLPAGWRKGTDLHEEAELQVLARGKNAFAIVLTEPKDDFDEGFTHTDHAELTFDKLLDGLGEAEIVRGPDSLRIGGRAAVQYEVIGSVRSLRIVYLHTTVDGADSFHQILAWTTPSRIDRNRADLDTIIASFSEIP